MSILAFGDPSLSAWGVASWAPAWGQLLVGTVFFQVCRALLVMRTCSGSAACPSLSGLDVSGLRLFSASLLHLSPVLLAVPEALDYYCLLIKINPDIKAALIGPFKVKMEMR